MSQTYSKYDLEGSLNPLILMEKFLWIPLVKPLSLMLYNIETMSEYEILVWKRQKANSTLQKNDFSQPIKQPELKTTCIQH